MSNRADRNRPIVLLALGILLGASIGLADGLTGLQAWSMLGRPDFFIRRNHSEEIHVILLTFSGALAGIAYGGILVHLAHSCVGKLRLALIYGASMVGALPLFFCVHYVVIAKRVPLTYINFFPEIAVFLLSVLLAYCLSDRTEEG